MNMLDQKEWMSVYQLDSIFLLMEQFLQVHFHHSCRIALAIIFNLGRLAHYFYCLHYDNDVIVYLHTEVNSGSHFFFFWFSL
jgi:hypothetical protein